jgi:putative ABC transport system substrate-binding protein
MGATRTIPVVAIDLETDPVASGFAASLARPGGNMSGFFLDLAEFSAKRLELLKETLPQIKRVVALWDPVLDRAPVTSLERAADTLGLKLLLIQVENQGDLVHAFSASANFKAGAVLVMQSPRLDILRPEILRLATDRRVPVAALFGDFAADGALMSYGPNVDDMTAQTADYIDKVLRGAKPGELPIQRPTRFDLVFNLRTAKRLGISVPPSILTRADTLIQ